MCVRERERERKREREKRAKSSLRVWGQSQAKSGKELKLVAVLVERCLSLVVHRRYMSEEGERRLAQSYPIRRLAQLTIYQWTRLNEWAAASGTLTSLH